MIETDRRLPDHRIKTLYDPAAGTGGMLSVAENYLREFNASATLKTFGQQMLKGDDVTQRTFTDEVLDDRMAEILRTKSPAERLAISFGMWRFAQQMIRVNLQRQHPDWTAEQVQHEAARRTSYGAV